MNQPWTAEYIVSEQMAIELIEGQFPELIPVQIKLLGEGFDNTVYLVNERFVFRFPRREVAVGLLETENQLLPAISARLHLSIPEPMFLGTPHGEYPWPFTGYRAILGKTPGHLTNEQRTLSVSRLAQFLKNLHQFPVDEAKRLHVPFDEINRLDIKLRKPKLEKFMLEIERNHLLKDDIHLLKQFLTTVREINLNEARTLVHGDLHARNLIVNNEGTIVGVIDWGDTHIGHPAVDLSIVYSFIPPESRHQFFEIYGEIDEDTKYLARFKGVYTAALLVLHLYDLGEKGLLEAAQESLRLALK